MKATLMAAASALLLTAGAAAAAPAVSEATINLHARPSARSPIVGTVPAGARIDVRGCVRAWCRVRFAGEQGFVPRRLLAMAGGPAVVAAAPGYVYDEPYDDYYDYGYDYGYGPSVGVFVGPGGRFHHRRHDGRTWQGRTWNGTRTGTWQGGTGFTGRRSGTWQGGGRTGSWQGNRSAGAATGISRSPGSVSPQVSAPAGMGAGGAVRGGGAVSAAPAAGAAGGGGGGGGAVNRR